MAQPFHQNYFEFAQDVRKTCHDLNNFLMILQCQHEYLGVLPSNEIESELAGVLRELGPLVESTAKDVHELSIKCREILEGIQ
tara:strand:- start:4456 stop:4704 length:249 start_codon:yes stop_codon:yes gene_type:complete